MIFFFYFFFFNFGSKRVYPLYLFHKTKINVKISNQPTVLNGTWDYSFVKVPFMCKLSSEIRKRPKMLLQNTSPKIKFTYAFRNFNTIADYLCSIIVYLFTCPSCQVICMGSTSQCSRHRILNHKDK